MTAPRPRIMVVRGDKLSSRAIEGFGGGWPSHMASMLEDGSFWDARDDEMVYKGALYPEGVQHRPAGYLQHEFDRWAIFVAPVGSEAVYLPWVASLESQVNKHYDSLGIWDFAKGCFTGQYADSNYAPRNPEDSKAWFCNELATWAAGRHGLVPWPQPWPVFTETPGASLNL